MEEKINYYSYDPDTIDGKRRQMQKLLDFYDPRRLRITREDLEELGMPYAGELYEEKPGASRFSAILRDLSKARLW